MDFFLGLFIGIIAGATATIVYAINASEKKKVVEVKRHAVVGEYIKIIDAYDFHNNFKNGDILKVIKSVGSIVYVTDRELIFDSEYVVLENYKGEVR